MYGFKLEGLNKSVGFSGFMGFVGNKKKISQVPTLSFKNLMLENLLCLSAI